MDWKRLAEIEARESKATDIPWLCEQLREMRARLFHISCDVTLASCTTGDDASREILLGLRDCLDELSGQDSMKKALEIACAKVPGLTDRLAEVRALLGSDHAPPAA